MATVLAGDIGGTSTRLRLVDAESRRTLDARVFRSGDYPGLEPICQQFLAGRPIAAAGFGIAGPVLDGRVTTTNLPWHIEQRGLAHALGVPHLALLNDLEALALGALHLPKSSLHVLQTGVPRQGTIAVVAAGTGLGQAQLFWTGERHLPGATEGGHVEFAPADAEDQALLDFARGRLVAQGAGPHVA
ncbi:MAG: glucokinase, partial [Deltaproteobacteria bacterium]|nr:glucokinase [Deltaproteobacteria bacterium]